MANQTGRPKLTILGSLAAFHLCFVALVAVVATSHFFVQKHERMFWATVAIFSVVCLFAIQMSRKTFREMIKLSVSTSTAERFGISTHVLMPFALVGSFLVVMISGEKTYGEQFVTADSLSVKSWLLYGLDNIMRASFFDFAEVFYIDLSKIEHANNFFCNSTVFIFRLILAATLLSMLANGIAFVWEYGGDAYQEITAQLEIEFDTIKVWDVISDTANFHMLGITSEFQKVDLKTAKVGDQIKTLGIKGTESTVFITEFHPPNVFAWGRLENATSARFEVQPSGKGKSIVVYLHMSKRGIWSRIVGTEDRNQKSTSQMEHVLRKIEERCFANQSSAGDNQ